MRQSIRPATPDDVADVHRLVVALAEYERAPDEVRSTPEHFRRALFPDHGRPTTFCHVAEVDGEVVGIAVWYLTFSTWTGVNGIWLEDLFVDPAHRGRGLGQGLLRALAGECVERGFQRLEWWVLDWNTPSIEFYRSLGSIPQDGWTVHRVDGAALSALAAP